LIVCGRAVAARIQPQNRIAGGIVQMALHASLLNYVKG
jgi:hypothetical protein